MGTEITRKLASIRRISAIDAIPKADRIVVATVDGWKLVTQKSNNFQPGDLVVYFEIDSFLPIHPAFEFLRDSSYKVVEGLGHGFRLKTIKLRGQVSQGLILPLRREHTEDGTLRWWIPNILGTAGPTGDVPPGTNDWDDPEAHLEEVQEGDDVTALLGVQKYEQPVHASLAGVVRSTFPSWIKKTDQERIQNLLGKFKKLPPNVYTDAAGVTYTREHDNWLEHEWEVTMKLDGSSMTVYHNRDKEGDEAFGVCSRNMDLVESESNAYWKVANKYNLREKLRDFCETFEGSIAIQGELMGPGVQGNRENFPELDLYVFDIYDIENATYLSADERVFLSDKFGLKHVPILSGNIQLDESVTLEMLLELANINSINHLVAEGIVFKSLSDPDISFKVINNRFLLDEGN